MLALAILTHLSETVNPISLPTRSPPSGLSLDSTAKVPTKIKKVVDINFRQPNFSFFSQNYSSLVIYFLFFFLSLHLIWWSSMSLVIGYLNTIAFLIVITFIVESQFYSDLVAIQNWHLTMKQYIETIEDNDTWTVKTLPTGKKLIGCKWIFASRIKLICPLNLLKFDLWFPSTTRRRYQFIKTLSTVANMIIVHPSSSIYFSWFEGLSNECLQCVFPWCFRRRCNYAASSRFHIDDETQVFSTLKISRWSSPSSSLLVYWTPLRSQRL